MIELGADDRRQVGGRDPSVGALVLDAAVFDQHGQELFDEERVAVGRVGDPALDVAEAGNARRAGS